MSPFEALMLICFGTAWPFSIVKSWRTGSNEGKSVFFLIVIFTGYASGVIHKFHYNWDPVVFLYMLNGVMVFADIMIYYRNAMSHRMPNITEADNPSDRAPQAVSDTE